MDVWILEDFEVQVWSKKHTIVAESINYICLKSLKSSSQHEGSMPNLGKLVPVAGVRNGRLLILKHRNSNIYVYDTRTNVMKKASTNMKNLVSFIPYKDSLFSMNRISQCRDLI
ncbi:hypothetical protein RND71_038607 [Anisodus tanguticus]|uniref:F-box associated domain-containing protein n=1 Tax=Anisodus tanguticus TaxID=243964 RepID=A0AAE1UX66_9SOLA|nr:hypothetical protein RND71_038607 [Anisodus tanguticus]